MKKEIKIIATLGILPIVGDLLNELVEDYPTIFSEELKQSLATACENIDSTVDALFADDDEDKLERAEQLNAISISFEKWAEETFSTE